MWLSEQWFNIAHRQLALEEMKKRVLEAQARVGRIEAALAEVVERGGSAALVQSLQALRSVRLVVAATLIAKVGDLVRIQNPKQLLAYVGLVPSEHSNGAHQPGPDHAGGQFPRAQDAG